MECEPTENYTWEGSRLLAPYENLMPGDMILCYGELLLHYISQCNSNLNKEHDKCNAVEPCCSFTQSCPTA